MFRAAAGVLVCVNLCCLCVCVCVCVYLVFIVDITVHFVYFLVQGIGTRSRGGR